MKVERCSMCNKELKTGFIKLGNLRLIILLEKSDYNKGIINDDIALFFCCKKHFINYLFSKD